MEEVFSHLRAGGVIAYPTETLWGLGADITNESALRRLDEIKGRANKPLSVLIENTAAAKRLGEFDFSIERLMYLFWPGAVTFIVTKKDTVSNLVTAGADSVGLRCSSEKLVAEIVAGYENPITTTSANRTGDPAALKRSDLSWLPIDVLIVGDKSIESGVGSTVVDLCGEQLTVLREGSISSKKIEMMWHKFKQES